MQRVLCGVSVLLIMGCVDDDAGAPGPNQLMPDRVMAADLGTSDRGGPGPDRGSRPDQGSQVDMALNCESFEYRGQTYDCREFDPCANDFLERLACCECDHAYCVPEHAMNCEGGGEETDALIPIEADMGPPPPDLFIDAMSVLSVRCTPCHSNPPPRPDDGLFSLYLLAPDRLTPAQLEANRTEASAYVNLGDPPASRILMRPTGQIPPHPVIFQAGAPDLQILADWVESL